MRGIIYLVRSRMGGWDIGVGGGTGGGVAVVGKFLIGLGLRTSMSFGSS